MVACHSRFDINSKEEHRMDDHKSSDSRIELQ
jgi:hypothetical protein